MASKKKLDIVVTDGYPMNPGDFEWDELLELGSVIVYSRTKKKDLVERIKDANVIIVNKSVIDKSIIDECPNLELICVSATGYDNVDVKAAKEAGITVSNAAGYSTNFVKQHVFALLLSYVNNTSDYFDLVGEGQWQKSKDFTFYTRTLHELQGLTLGILGLGTIGQGVAKIAIAFDMKVITIERKSSKPTLEGVTYVDEKTFFSTLDILTIHIPLNEKNRHYINAERLSLMKPSAIIINTSRGPIIDDDALITALDNDKIEAALLDVLSSEPPQNNHLTAHHKCYITPHVAWASLESRIRLFNIVIDNVKNWQKGKPSNVIS